MSRTDQLRQRMIQLEMELIQLRHAVAEEERREDAEHDAQVSDIDDRVNVAMGFVVNYQASTRPMVLYQEGIDPYQFAKRDPHPKECSAMAAACDLLERYFDGGVK